MAASEVWLDLKNTSVRKPLQNCVPVSALRKLKRNRWRILRRKRSKLRYWARRKEIRSRRKSDELCGTVSLVNLADLQMDVSQFAYVPVLGDVAAWHQKNQAAYWKSRALALEYENRVLYRLLQERHFGGAEYDARAEERDWVGREQPARVRKQQPKEETQKDFWDPPNKKQKQEQLAALYGEKSSKIAGMETAVQLNYDLFVEKHNPPFWPNIPIKL